MAIRFDCPACGEQLEVEPGEAGARTRCVHCQASLVAPSAPRLLVDPTVQRAVAAAFQETRTSPAPRRLEPGWKATVLALQLTYLGDVITLVAFALVPALAFLARSTRGDSTPQAVTDVMPVEVHQIVQVWLPLAGIALGAAGMLLAIFGPLPRRGVHHAAAGLAVRLLLALVVIAPAVGWSTGAMGALRLEHVAWLIAAALTLRVLRAIGQRFELESLIRRTSGFVIFLIVPMVVIYALLPVLDSGLLPAPTRALVMGALAVLGMLWIALVLAYFFALRQAVLAVGSQLRRASAPQDPGR